MELNSKTIHDVVHPTAAFTKIIKTHPTTTASIPRTDEFPSWAESQLNPKNRVDSLEPLQNPLWRIDGCTGLGTQYYAVPLFLSGGPPMRFDVFVPEEVAQTPVLRHTLDLDRAFHTKDASRVRRLGIARHILRALQVWTIRSGLSSIAKLYEDLPFGSRIVFENLDLNVHNIKISTAAMHVLERQLLPLSRLGRILGVPQETLPETLDISKLRVVEQLHDSVCLVRLIDRTVRRNQPPTSREQEQVSSLWILKALTSDTRYLYHELRALLTMEPHPHVISRPRFLITKYCKFGGKTAVVGFVITYHPGGTLRDYLPMLRMHGRLHLGTQLRLATQLTSAVVHVRKRGRMFYPDLRLDNLVLSSSLSVVMVDFEQRGVWCEFAAPEVNALEYVRILASDGIHNGGGDIVVDGSQPDSDAEALLNNPRPVSQPTAIPAAVRQRYAALLDRYLPEWAALQSHEDYAAGPDHNYASYNIPWLCLSEVEQEAAEVYMLGRVLWCLFEGQSAPQPSAVWQSYRLEPDLEFPEYRRTPQALRALIDRCTRGRRKGLSEHIIRRASRLVLRAVPPGEPQDVELIQKLAREWWQAEIVWAEEFLRERDDLKARGEWTGNCFGRPNLEEVLAYLEAFQAEITANDATVTADLEDLCL
ncbi:hypothetical protein VTK73DRAFT_3276 [Phialemonium thermophilum]|uniref:Protein kinase domain-containing protein n=1 Tax=Phialemonium thermophilum TaxID=223376 RepID=A0ABR3Y943_9PEZI